MSPCSIRASSPAPRHPASRRRRREGGAGIRPRQAGRPAVRGLRRLRGGRFAAAKRLLKPVPLLLERQAQPDQGLRPASDVKIEVQPQPLGLPCPAVGGVHLVVHVKLSPGQSGLPVHGHCVRAGVVGPELPYPVHDKALPDPHGHDRGLPRPDDPLHVPQGVVAAVRDQNYVAEPCVREVPHDGVEAPGVRDVPGECAVVHRLVSRQGVDHHGEQLGQGQALLVLPPVYVGQGVAVRAARGGVHRAHLVPAQP